MSNYKTKPLVPKYPNVFRSGDNLYAEDGQFISSELISIGFSTSGLVTSGSLGSAAFQDSSAFVASGTAVSPEDLSLIATSGNGVGVQRPLAPYRPVNSITQGQTKPLAMEIQGNLLFVYYQQGHVVDIIDISDPANPNKLKTHAGITYGNPNDMLMKDNVAYFSRTSTNNIQAVDFTDINSPIQSSTYSTNGGPFGMALSGNYLYVAGSAGGGVAVHDISNFSNLAKVGNTDNFGAAGDCSIINGHLFTTQYASNAIRVYDLADPVNPSFITSLSIGTMAVWTEVDEENDLLFACDYGGGNSFHIIDVSDPTAPSGISSTNNGARVHFARRVKDYLIVTGDGSGGKCRMSMYDISNLSSPSLISYFEGDAGSTTTANRGQAVINDNYVYVGQHLVKKINVFKLLDPGYMYLDLGITPQRPIWWTGFKWIFADGTQST